jgi:hypothetical protein
MVAGYFTVIIQWVLLSLYGGEGRGSNSSSCMDSPLSYHILLQETRYWRREFIRKKIEIVRVTLHRDASRYVCTFSAILTERYHFTRRERFHGDLRQPATIKRTEVFVSSAEF